MTHLAPSPWRGFCLAAPAPSAGSLPMPVGCPALTQRRPWAGYLELRAAGGEDPAAGKGLRRRPLPVVCRLSLSWRMPRTRSLDLSGLDPVELELELRALLDERGLTAPAIRRLWALGFSDLLDNVGGARRLVVRRSSECVAGSWARCRRSAPEACLHAARSGAIGFDRAGGAALWPPRARNQALVLGCADQCARSRWQPSR